jgi:glycosyltransferase involved in cell wall biosynthesis
VVPRKIKIIHVITRFDKGGSAENTFLTAKGLDGKRYDVTLIRGLSFESQLTGSESAAVENNVGELERGGVRVMTVPEIVRRIQPWCDAKALRALIKIFHREKPHIVHTHTSKAGILGRWAAFVAGVPVIVHTPHGHVFWGYFGRLKTRLFIFMEKLSALVTDTLIMLTDSERDDHLRYGIAPPEKFEVIHSGIDVDRFSSMAAPALNIKRELKVPEGNLIVGTVGRLTAIKGPEYLIRAAGEVVRRNPHVTFILMGDGELRETLEATADEIGVRECVRFTGWRDDVAAIMSVMDVFVLPSLNEGMGRVLAEAMAAGKPIVASDVGGIPDLVSDGENGYLVPPGDTGALASRLVHLLGDKDARERMGNVGRKRAGRYSSETMVKHIDDLYTALLLKNRTMKEWGLRKKSD